MRNLFIGGTHRGGFAIVTALSDKTTRLYDPEWKLADPKDNRALHLSVILKDRFPALRPHPLQMRVQDALAYSGDRDALILALDTIADTRQTLEARRPGQPVTWQLTGRGPGGGDGAHLALQGTLYPGDQQTTRSVSLLLPTLDRMSQAASSRTLTGPDPLTAQLLTPMRHAVSQRTAQHLAEIEREPAELSGGPLSIMLGSQHLYPLLVVPGQAEEKYSQQTALALESAGLVPPAHLLARGPVHLAVVAVVIPNRRAIHFMKVTQDRRGQRRIAGVTTFQSPRATPSRSLDSAIFTD